MENERIIITRKITLVPEISGNKEHISKIMEHTKKMYAEKIAYFEEKKKKCKGKEEKKKIEKRIAELTQEQEKFMADGVIEKPHVNDYTYELIRSAMRSESCRKNIIISYVFSELLNRDAQHMDIKERNKLISELVNYGFRVKGSDKGSLFDIVDIDNPLGGYGLAFSQDLTKKIKDMVNKDRILEGKSSIISYKEDSPFTISKQKMSFSHDYDSYEELCEHIQEKDCNLYFNFGSNGNSTIARFRINLGSDRHKKNKEELISVLLKIYSGEYKPCGSRLGIENGKIILNLSISIPKQERKLDENVVVGVDLGIAVPAMCALNNNMYKRLAIGSSDDFLKQRTKLQAQKRRLQRALKNTSGGHGRKKKLEALERLEKKEANFVNTYCHMVSRRVVDFALKNNAKYINIENLTGYATNDFVLRNWSFFKLQTQIIYKAEKYGIIVRKVNPYYTSLVCSVCGSSHSGQRKSQAEFVCANKDCKSHTKYKKGFNADFNAARNIAMSTLFSDNGMLTEKDKEKAREYYGVEEKQ